MTTSSSDSVSAEWSRTYDVASFLVSRQGRLSLYGLLNILQDAALAHALQFGHGMREASERNAFWVLTRQKVSMTKWPLWNDRIVLKTWIRPAAGAFFVRDFEIRSENGADILCEATTSWLLMNAVNHKPIREHLSHLGFPSSPQSCSFDTEKIPVRTDIETLERFEVRNSDIDGNNHVNNTRYAQWILDAIPIAAHGSHILDSYSVNFLAETHLGDVIEIQTAQGAQGSYFHGLRTKDQKIVFTAQLKSHEA